MNYDILILIPTAIVVVLLVRDLFNSKTNLFNR